VEFSGITAGIKSYPENEFSKNADYVISIRGDSMESES
jgi:phage repressor protein C with HTH and peptisase S24 domain